MWYYNLFTLDTIRYLSICNRTKKTEGNVDSSRYFKFVCFIKGSVQKVKKLMNLLLYMLLYVQAYYEIRCKSFQRNQNLKAVLISVS